MKFIALAGRAHSGSSFFSGKLELRFVERQGVSLLDENC